MNASWFADDFAPRRELKKTRSNLVTAHLG
jgi:hypothetical protein